MPEITLSGKDVMCKVDEMANGVLTSKDTPLREVEIGMLKSVFAACHLVEKDLKKTNLASDMYEQVENLTGDDAKLTMTSEDLQNFKTGWEAMATQRPGIWMRCGKLKKQLV